MVISILPSCNSKYQRRTAYHFSLPCLHLLPSCIDSSIIDLPIGHKPFHSPFTSMFVNILQQKPHELVIIFRTFLSVNFYLHFAFISLTPLSKPSGKCWWSKGFKRFSSFQFYPSKPWISIMGPRYALIYCLSLAPRTLIQGDYSIGTHLQSHTGC